MILFNSKFIIMTRNISFKFEFETEEIQAAHDLFPAILEHLKQLQNENRQFLNIELSLLRSDAPPKGKTAILTIHLPEGVIREETGEEDWAVAVEKVFKQVHESLEHAMKLD
jgi:ribosome-associated translation inhibitor RaiA